MVINHLLTQMILQAENSFFFGECDFLFFFDILGTWSYNPRKMELYIAPYL